MYVYIYIYDDSLIKIDVGASGRIVKFVKIKEIPKKKHLGNAISSRGLLANLSLSHEDRLTAARSEEGGGRDRLT